MTPEELLSNVECLAATSRMYTLADSRLVERIVEGTKAHLHSLAADLVRLALGMHRALDRRLSACRC